ncbi:prepilin-type cleavage/methylation domain-containing protein [Moraxella lacunata]|uniref:pilin n=1 Tax=Moraxella lacunata TaxID=477 RepID=UPI0031F5C26A|nr:prepilin-type cleavage/methylation domain-containing protein [Moraxella lacunata]
MTFIGILAAIALPAYQDYISKSQTTRVVGELAAGKTAVDAALFEGKTPVLSEASSTSKENIGLTTSENSATPRSNLMESVNLEGFANNGEGSISATLGGNANKDIAKTVISQKRTTDGVWTCEVDGNTAPKYKPKFTPAGCTTK